MGNIDKLLTERALPSVLSGVKDAKDFEKKKERIKKLLSDREYGEIPRKPDHMSVKEISATENFACGKGVLKNLILTFEMDGVTFSVPAVSAIPKTPGKHPAFVHIAFAQNGGGKYVPIEEIVERGFALFAFYYDEATSDDGNFKTGIAKHLVKSRRKNNAPGKIALWAWTAMRLMDYVETLGDVIDLDNVAVIGHSRLGKTALLTGAFDTRFKYVISNDSGCAGAAIERGKVGERYHKISSVFPYWFAPKFNKDAGSGVEFPFDQHFLMALSVPRCVIVGSAADDVWADPESEFLGVAALSQVYELYKKQGVIHDGRIPSPKTVLADGDAVYYVREGAHFLSRHDWNTYMDIINSKMNIKDIDN